MKIKKAVIPIAGKGTRFLPATKTISKEIIPIINYPMIYYVVKEAVEAGIEEIIFVTASGKEEIENFFDRNLELEAFLAERGKKEDFELIKKIGEMVNIITVRQKEQLGLGHAILMAEAVVGSETFAVLLGDDITLGKTPVTKQLINCSLQNSFKSVIGVMEVPKEHTRRYGIVSGKFLKDDKQTLRMTAMVEKPAPEKAPTTLATPGRYILTAEIFDALKKIPRGAGGEYQLTDAINMLCEKDEVYAHVFEGERFDTGDIIGYIDATIEFALRDEKYKKQVYKLIEEKYLKYK
ncbi:MAG: UTP--glucose-1-phosphate uridylyltransferase GalU [Bacteriovoracaceae bacterium]|nr:UTP--glucose-1-phosphate uridylyltransferase GalU [Bacteriovoracaceae bacterium]